MKKWVLVAIAFILYLIVFGFWLWDQVNAPTGNSLTMDTASRLIAMGRLAALTAVFLLMLQVLFIARARWVEPLWGMDRLTKLHHLKASVVVALLLGHVFLVTKGYALQGEVTYFEQVKDFVKSWEEIIPAMFALGLLILVGFLSVSIARKHLRYEWWHATHLVTYGAFALVLEHPFDLGMDLTNNSAFRIFGYVLLSFVGLNLLWYRMLLPIYHYSRHRFRVVAVHAETRNVTTVNISGRNMHTLHVIPGQFVIVRFLAKGFGWQPHPFSVSAPFDGATLRLSIKSSGDFTSRIPELLKGTRVVIDGPHGAFTPHKSESAKVLLIAGGIGITPIRAMLPTFIASNVDIVLLYASRKQDEIVFKGELDELATIHTQFRVVHILSNEPEWSGEKGMIDENRIKYLVPDHCERDVYLCGPPPMMVGLLKTLQALKIPSKQIYYERFSF